MPKKKRWSYRRLQKESKSSPSLNSGSATVGTDEVSESKENRRSTLVKELRMLDGCVQERELPSSMETGNRLVHWDSTKKLISENCVCRFCGGSVRLSETTVGVATELILKCSDCKRKKTI